MDGMNAGGSDLFGEPLVANGSTLSPTPCRKPKGFSELRAVSRESILFGPGGPGGLSSRIKVVGVLAIDPAKCTGYGGSPRADLPFDPRLDRDLLNDVQASGVREPIIVRKEESGSYAILSGNRRTRVVRELRDRGAAVNLPAVVIECPDADAVTIAHFSNKGRQGETAMQQARAVYWAWANVFGKKQVTVAQHYRYDPAKVCRLLFLADLPTWITAICKNPEAISENVAGKLQGAISNDAAAVEQRARQIAAEGRRLSGPELKRALIDFTSAEAAAPALIGREGQKVGHLAKSRRGSITVLLDRPGQLAATDLGAVIRQIMTFLHSADVSTARPGSSERG